MGMKEATVRVDWNREVGRVDKMVFGHFLEHVERVVYGGISDIGHPDADGMGVRTDVVSAIREMGGAHIVRWPGGNFVSYYDWRDGIGPREKRPQRFDVVWGNRESNHFGTDEFLELCRQLEAEPFITVNMGNGTLRDACEWVEYCQTRTQYPKVNIWGLGNEHYGPWQVGHYSAAEYGRMAKQFGQFMRVVQPDMKLVGVGYAEGDWNEVVLQEAGHLMDWMTIHLYGRRTFLFGEDDYLPTLAACKHFENELERFSDQLTEAEKTVPRDAPIEIWLEEWNGRHYAPRQGGVTAAGKEDPDYFRKSTALNRERAKRGRLLRESPRNISDVLFVAGVFNACVRQSRRVTMSNYVFLLNAHGPLMVDADGVTRTALFDIFRLFANSTQDVAVGADVAAESFLAEPAVEPAPREKGPIQCDFVDVAATRDPSGRNFALTVINRHRHDGLRLKLELGQASTAGSGTLHVVRAEAPGGGDPAGNGMPVHTDTRQVALADGYVDLPPASVAFLSLGEH